MVSGQSAEARALPFTRKERLVVGIVAAFMGFMGLGSYFFNVPPASPDLPSCQLASNCGQGDPFAPPSL